MSDRHGSYPPDEPVIGASYPPPPPRAPGVPSPPPYADTEDEYYDDDDEYAGEYDDDAYYDDYYDDQPARQPIFYVFVGLAVLLGGLFIFLLISLVRGGGDDAAGPGPTTAAGFDIRVDSPINGDRIETGKDTDVLVRASSNEPVTKFELIRDNATVDQVQATAPSKEGIYAATLKLRFDRKGEYKVWVRVTSQSGATRESGKVTVVAIEPVGDKPVSIKGKVVALVNLRSGPGENFEAVGQLQPNQEVRILGKTRDSEWLLIDVDGGRWVKRQAIQELDSLALVPVRDPTPTPPPPTNTPKPSPSASPSPSPSATANPNAPDFAPTNAILIDGGGKLRVTVANLSTNSFDGSLVVAVGGVGSGGTLTQAFAAKIIANGSATVDFELNPPVTQQRTAQVTVDPDNAIKETNEDNNRATFALAPPVEQPELVIVSTGVDPANGLNLLVVIRNNGGPLPSSSVAVKITVSAQGNAAEQSKTIALAKGQDATFIITKPGSGAARVDVIINGTPVTSTNITLQ